MSTIGNMNGPWAILLRLCLATYPAILLWCTWLTSNQFKDNAFRGEGERFTAADAATQTQLVLGELNTHLAEIDVKLSQMVPASELANRNDMEALKERIMRLEIRCDELHGGI